MPRTESKAVPGCYGPVPHSDYELGRLTMEELFRIVAKEMDKLLLEGQATLTMKELKTRRRRGREISV